jgi:hypothetical protein
VAASGEKDGRLSTDGFRASMVRLCMGQLGYDCMLLDAGVRGGNGSNARNPLEEMHRPWHADETAEEMVTTESGKNAMAHRAWAQSQWCRPRTNPLLRLLLKIDEMWTFVNENVSRERLSKQRENISTAIANLDNGTARV